MKLIKKVATIIVPNAVRKEYVTRFCFSGKIAYATNPGKVMTLSG